MSSFSKMGVWPIGYLRAYTSWLLRNRRELSARVDTITAEVARIGEVIVEYESVKQADGSIKRTEVRTGIWVTPDSSVGKLMRAYVAMGGNPYDISMFMYPNSTEVVRFGADGQPIIQEKYPHSGLAAPISAEANEPVSENGQSGYEPHPGGYIRLDSYYPPRMGGRIGPGAYDHNGIVKTMHLMRDWAKQDIDERLRRIEWQIVKLCDLREQLIRERDEVLVQAFGGTMAGVADFDESRFSHDFLVQNLVQGMYDLVFQHGPDGNTILAPSDKVPNLRFTFDDLPSESNRFLLGC